MMTVVRKKNKKRYHQAYLLDFLWSMPISEPRKQMLDCLMRVVNRRSQRIFVPEFKYVVGIMVRAERYAGEFLADEFFAKGIAALIAAGMKIASLAGRKNKSVRRGEIDEGWGQYVSKDPNHPTHRCIPTSLSDNLKIDGVLQDFPRFMDAIALAS